MRLAIDRLRTASESAIAAAQEARSLADQTRLELELLRRAREQDARHIAELRSIVGAILEAATLPNSPGAHLLPREPRG